MAASHASLVSLMRAIVHGSATMPTMAMVVR